MFYKFNSLIGRIAPSTQAEAYSPQGLSPVTRGPSVIVFDTKATQVAREAPVAARAATAAAGARGAASTPTTQGLRLGVVPSTPRYRRIMEMQNAFLKEDGKLVWQKLGRDRMSYFATLTLMAVGTAFSISVLYRMSFPRPTED
eukprot:TRINITY_DN142428_c0_g1_i2.p1 TRINITY_DN142428_c0_g1~~TRINITY_DN142428_c0_g1_i2.p1  ORF type:complete len:144 (+),score=9.01 TRINITY_DN142428_c0_g1_i2:112-543(+)